MFKTMVGIVAAVLLTLCCSETVTLLSASSAIAVDREAALTSISRSTTIEVIFEGLMVFHKEQGERYEVGILSPKAAPDHEFHVKIDEQDTKFNQPSSPAEKWILEIRKITGGPSEAGGGTVLRRRGHNGRLHDSLLGQTDFDWAVDLESSDFYDQPLEMAPGLLTPIIHLPYGELYTKYKTPMVQRNKGKNGKFSDFGYVTETTALGVQLHSDEEMVLRVADTNPEKVIFEKAFGTFRTVAIRNAPGQYAPHYQPQSGRQSRTLNKNDLCKPGRDPKPSHFTFYYNLFPKIVDDEKYDFQVKCPLKLPFNVYPFQNNSKMLYGKVFWIESMPCGKILLGQRDTNNPLK